MLAEQTPALMWFLNVSEPVKPAPQSSPTLAAGLFL
jgi:hypothetical protein